MAAICFSGKTYSSTQLKKEHDKGSKEEEGWTGTKSCPLDIKPNHVTVLCKKGLKAKQVEYLFSKYKNKGIILDVRTKVPKVLNNRKIFLLVASIHCLQVSFFRSEGKCSHL